MCENSDLTRRGKCLTNCSLTEGENENNEPQNAGCQLAYSTGLPEFPREMPGRAGRWGLAMKAFQDSGGRAIDPPQAAHCESEFSSPPSRLVQLISLGVAVLSTGGRLPQAGGRWSHFEWERSAVPVLSCGQDVVEVAFAGDDESVQDFML